MLLKQFNNTPCTVRPILIELIKTNRLKTGTYISLNQQKIFYCTLSMFPLFGCFRPTRPILSQIFALDKTATQMETEITLAWDLLKFMF